MNYNQQAIAKLQSALCETDQGFTQGYDGEYYMDISVDPDVYHSIQLQLVQCPDIGLVMCFPVEVVYTLHTTVHRITAQVQTLLHNLYMKHYTADAKSELLNMLASISVCAIPYDIINGGSVAQAAAYASARLHSIIGAPHANESCMIPAGVVSEIEVAMWMPLYGKTGGHHVEYAVRNIANRLSPFNETCDAVMKPCIWKLPLTAWTLTQTWYFDNDACRMPSHLWLLSSNEGSPNKAEWAWAHRVPGHSVFECQSGTGLDENELVSLVLTALDTIMLAQPNIGIQPSNAANTFAILGSVELVFKGEWWAVAVHGDDVAVKKLMTADRKQSKTHLFKVRKVD